MPARTLTEAIPPPENVAELSQSRRSARNAEPSAKSPAETNALCAVAARLAANHYEVTLTDLRAPTRRSRRASRARHVAMYLAHVVFGLRHVAIGLAFGRSRRSVAYACGWVEDARDDPAFDAALAGLEMSAPILLELEREKEAA
jgi:chromosomal replication initiation ATPase DnaA